MSAIYNYIKENELLDANQLNLVDKFNNYLIKEYDLKSGIDSKNIEINDSRINIITNPIVKELNDDAFVKVLDIATASEDSRYIDVLDTLLKEENLKDKWDINLLNYLCAFLFNSFITSYNLEMYMKDIKNTRDFIKYEPVFRVLTSKRFSTLKKDEFDKELNIILKSKSYYANDVARVLENNIISDEKRTLAIDILNDKHEAKTEEQKEYEQLLEKKRLSDDERKRLERYKTVYEEYYEDGYVDNLDFKEKVASAAVSSVMTSEMISNENFVSILYLLDQDVDKYDTKRDERVRKKIVDCLNNEEYIKNEKQFSRNFNYILENYQNLKLDYAVDFAASPQACYYNDLEFLKAVDFLQTNFYEDKTFVTSAYSLLTNENISYETEKQEYFSLLEKKDILEIKKEAAYNNYLAFEKQIVQKERANKK